MFTEKELKKYLVFGHQIKSSGREYIMSSREAEPYRMVGTHARTNVCSWYVSEKMGHSISSESRGPEKSFSLISEYDDQVLEIWCQPQPVKVCRTNKNGKKSWGAYFPDYMLLKEDGPTIFEVKTKDELEKLIVNKPVDWIKESEHTYVYIPAKEAFDKIGLIHKVFVYTDDMRYLAANVELIMQARRMKTDSVSSELENKILEKLDAQFGWSLYELRKKLKLGSYTPIINMIDKKKIYFDIENDLLSNPESCMVARTPKLLTIAKEINDKEKIYKKESYKVVSAGLLPSHKCAEEILRKLERIDSGETGRSIRRWKALIRKGLKKGLTRFQSLIPKTHLQGCRKSQLIPAVEECLMWYLYEEHPKKRGINKYRSYCIYRVVAKEAHPDHDPVSYKTFIVRLEKIPPSKIAYINGGKRAANAVADPSDPDKRSLNYQLAWQSAAIDHYLADIYLICQVKDNVYVLRPWITAMIDLATSSILAVTISFSSPSRKSCAKVIRDCVRKHGRLPSEIIVDRGSDFTSVYFASLLAHYGITYSLRPASHSRYGGEIEGFFGDFMDMWLSQLPGNTVDYNNARSVDKDFKPENNAVVDPYEFYRELDAFCLWRENQCRGKRLISPAAQKENDESDYPFVGVLVEYNEEFMLATAVETTTYKVDFQRGLHIGRFWYWHPDISKIRGKKSKLEVRIDPENPYLVYALIENQWVPCTNSNINLYSIKNHNSQLIEGLLQAETEKSRYAEKLEADEQLVSVMKALRSESDDVKEMSILKVEQNNEHSKESIFERIKNAVVKKIDIKYWEGK